MRIVFGIVIGLVMVVGLTPAAFAFDQEAVRAIHDVRPDLQAAFDENGVAIPGTAAGFLIDIYDWAEQYGWREHEELASYAPTSSFIPEHDGSAHPEVTAENFIVLDKSSGQILAAQNADVVWPVASLTKLVTADVVLEEEMDMELVFAVNAIDDVGGAKLYVEDGATFTLDDLFYSALVGSANNAANALSRTCGMNHDEFLFAMNRRPYELGLAYTEFVDPTGIELGNVSTAREMARLAGHIFSSSDIRRYTTTASRYVDVLSEGSQKQIKNTNWMLYYPEFDDVYVTAGKTGYLHESKWNLAVQLRSSAEETDKELLIIIFGAASRPDSFYDTEQLANWAWQNHDWISADAI